MYRHHMRVLDDHRESPERAWPRGGSHPVRFWFSEPPPRKKFGSTFRCGQSGRQQHATGLCGRRASRSSVRRRGTCDLSAQRLLISQDIDLSCILLDVIDAARDSERATSYTPARLSRARLRRPLDRLIAVKRRSDSQTIHRKEGTTTSRTYPLSEPAPYNDVALVKRDGWHARVLEGGDDGDRR